MVFFYLFGFRDPHWWEHVFCISLGSQPPCWMPRNQPSGWNRWPWAIRSPTAPLAPQRKTRSLGQRFSSWGAPGSWGFHQALRPRNLNNKGLVSLSRCAKVSFQGVGSRCCFLSLKSGSLSRSESSHLPQAAQEVVFLHRSGKSQNGGISDDSHGCWLFDLCRALRVWMRIKHAYSLDWDYLLWVRTHVATKCNDDFMTTEYNCYFYRTERAGGNSSFSGAICRDGRVLSALMSCCLLGLLVGGWRKRFRINHCTCLHKI